MDVADFSRYSEHELIVQAQAGNRRCFDELVRRSYKFVYNIAYRMLGEEEAAADATQTAFVRAYRSLPLFRAHSSFTTWLYRIVSNVCLDMARGQKHFAFVSLSDPNPQDQSVPRDICDPQASVERTIWQNELQQHIHAALGKIRAEYRIVIVLYDLAGFSYEEIAQILRVPLGTVKSRLNRARLALREELKHLRELFE